LRRVKSIFAISFTENLWLKLKDLERPLEFKAVFNKS